MISKNTFGMPFGAGKIHLGCHEMTSPMLTKMHVEMQGSRHEWLQKMHLECHSGLDKYIWVVTHDEPNVHEDAFEMQGSLHEWSQKIPLECHSWLEKYIWVVTNDEPNAHENAF